jgi:hypothetical protein
MDAVSRICAIGGRALVLVSALLVMVMPITEYFWHFDRFPYGGQDFELSILSVLAILGLMIVLIQHAKSGVSFLFGLRQKLAMVLQNRWTQVDNGIREVVAACSGISSINPVSRKAVSPLRI